MQRNTAAEMNNFTSKLLKFKGSNFAKYGLPFLLIMVGGSFGLEQFSKIRYQFSKKETIDRKELEKHGVYMKKPGEVTLEGEYEKLKSMDIDTWEQVRGPRPWEENVST